jgi:hypothetical protein
VHPGRSWAPLRCVRLRSCLGWVSAARLFPARRTSLEGAPTYNRAGWLGRAYAAFAADIDNGTRTVPDFADAVGRHEVIAAIERASHRGTREGEAQCTEPSVIDHPLPGGRVSRLRRSIRSAWSQIKVVWRLGLEDDLRPFYAAVADDPVLSASIEHNSSEPRERAPSRCSTR